MKVLLDSGPLSLMLHPKGNDEANRCNKWVSELLRQHVVLIPEICDYEIRRELVRANKTASVRRLTQAREAFDYLPITTLTMERAASFWAQARNQGNPTASQNALDADMILCAQADEVEGADVVVATTNVRHIQLFADAKLWTNISP